ncbi:MAG: hypothetical protein ACHQUC_06565 [Chlamydiales bacterium]
MASVNPSNNNDILWAYNLYDYREQKGKIGYVLADKRFFYESQTRERTNIDDGIVHSNEPYKELDQDGLTSFFKNTYPKLNLQGNPPSLKIRNFSYKSSLTKETITFALAVGIHDEAISDQKVQDNIKEKMSKVAQDSYPLVNVLTIRDFPSIEGWRIDNPIGHKGVLTRRIDIKKTNWGWMKAFFLAFFPHRRIEAEIDGNLLTFCSEEPENNNMVGLYSSRNWDFTLYFSKNLRQWDFTLRHSPSTDKVLSITGCNLL